MPYLNGIWYDDPDDPNQAANYTDVVDGVGVNPTPVWTPPDSNPTPQLPPPTNTNNVGQTATLPSGQTGIWNGSYWQTKADYDATHPAPAPSPSPTPVTSQRVTTVNIPGVTKAKEWKDLKADDLNPNPLRNLTPKQIEKLEKRQEAREFEKAIYRSKQEAQDKALADLDKYKSGDGYDIAKYIRDTGDANKLRQAGFSEKQIQEARKIAEKPISLNQFTEEYFEKKGFGSVDRRPLVRAYDDHRIDANLKKLAEYDAHLREASSAYIKKYGKGAYAGSIAGGALSSVFIPAKALSPEITIKDVSGMDWAIGGAQIALLAVPFVGGAIGGTAGTVVSKGVQVAAGGVFAADTAKNWSSMNPTERAIALAFDTLIIGSALPGKQIASKVGKQVKGTVAEMKAHPEAGFIKLDTSRPLIETLEWNGIKVPEAIKGDLQTNLRNLENAIAVKDTEAIAKEASNLRKLAAELDDVEVRNALDDYAKNLEKNPESSIKLSEAAKPKEEDIRQNVDTIDKFKKAREEELRPERKETPASKKVTTQVKERPKIEDYPVKETATSEEKAKALQKAIDEAKKAREEATALENRKKEIDVEIKKLKDDLKSEPENPPTPKENAELKARVKAEIARRQAEQTKIRQERSRLTSVIRKADAKVKAKLLPFVKPSPATQTSPQTSTRTQPEAMTQPATQTHTKPQTETKTQPATQTETQTEAETKPETRTETQAKLQTETQTKTDTGRTGLSSQRPRERIRKDLPSPSLTDKEKRRAIKEAGGAIAFRMGQLNKKDIWHVIVDPYTAKENYFVVVGRTPQNASIVRGPKSAYKTAQLLYGHNLDRSVRIDAGITDVRLDPIGGKRVRISFTGDPKLQTTGDFNISDRGRVFPLRQDKVGR
jgi:hypothetical protein